MARPRLLDLFCGAGGAAMGYHRAGFDVTGVDIAPQPRYPFPFVQADAMTFPLDGFDAIHASPICRRWTAYPLTPEQRERHPDLITPLRPILAATGLPYIMENVVRAPLRDYTLICGAAMGLKVIVHRRFETNWLLMSPGCACPKDATIKHGFINRRDHGPLGPGRQMPNRDPAAWLAGAGLEGFTGQGAKDAIPPAYTEYIGAQLLDALEFPAQEPAGRGSGGQAVGG
jgi:DNA (cytosine-5)-methyltransferase 1